jgi:nucleoside-diphosphate-sugar epimerase
VSPAKIVVTGGAGYIGSVVTSHLLAAGKQVTVVDRLVYAGESLLGFLTHPCFRFVKGDVRKPESFAPALAGADAVVHLAAIVGEGACEMDQAAAWSTNFSGTEAMLAAAREGGVKRFVFISTCSNYGVSDPAELADEGVPLRPMSLYARSKVEAERHVLDRAGDLCAVILRLGTI